MAEATPNWLDMEFLTKCLQSKDYYKDAEIVQFNIYPFGVEGSNYGSCINKLKLVIKDCKKQSTTSISLIMKSPLKNEKLEVFTMACKDVEAMFYYKFLPIAQRLGCESFAPNCFFSPIPSVLVMEDLKEQGFVMVDRCLQLDYDHCRMYAIISAKFHAISLAVHKVDAVLVESLGEEKLFSHDLQTSKYYRIWMDQAIDCAVDFIEKTDDYKTFAKLLHIVKPYLFDQVIEAHTRKEGLNCLNQGDPWTTNMMFRYDQNGAVSEIKLLDFQALRYGNPATDLVFFLWTSAQHDVRENNLDDIYQIYCETFNNTLHELGCSESKSYCELIEDIKSLRPLMVFLVLVFIPMQVSPEPLDLVDIMAIENHENGKLVNKMTKFYNAQFCEKYLLRFVGQLKSVGVFESLENIVKHNLK